MTIIYIINHPASKHVNLKSYGSNLKPIIKALANEDTLLPTQMFPRLPASAIFVADTNFVSRTQKNVSDFVQKYFVSATNVSQFAQPKKHQGQQCVRNNVSSFTRAFMDKLFWQKTMFFFSYLQFYLETNYNISLAYWILFKDKLYITN